MKATDFPDISPTACHKWTIYGSLEVSVFTHKSIASTAILCCVHLSSTLWCYTHTHTHTRTHARTHTHTHTHSCRSPESTDKPGDGGAGSLREEGDDVSHVKVGAAALRHLHLERHGHLLTHAQQLQPAIRGLRRSREKIGRDTRGVRGPTQRRCDGADPGTRMTEAKQTVVLVAYSRRDARGQERNSRPLNLAELKAYACA